MALAYVASKPDGRTLRALNYTPEIERLRALGRSRATFRLDELVSRFGPAYARGFKRYDCSPAHGVELLSQSDMFALEPKGRWILGERLVGLEDYRIHKWQVLLAGNGTLGKHELYGRGIIADSRLAGKIVGSDANVLVFEEPGGDESLFAYAFLCTSVGVRAIRSCSYGTKNLRHRIDMLRELPIPRPGRGLVGRVASLIREAVDARESFAGGVAAARAIIESLPEASQALEMCAERRAGCVTWSGALPTLCGWNYAGAGGALRHLQQKWSGRLGDLVSADDMFRGPRSSRTACSPPYGVDFFSQRDVFLMRGFPQRIVRPDLDANKLLAQDATLLFAAQGADGERDLFGRVAYVGPHLAGKAVTEHLMRLQASGIWSRRLYGYLSTLLGFRLVRTAAVGTAQKSLRHDLIRSLPVPDLGARWSLVEHHVEEAHEALARAMAKEAEAISMIEEEVLPEWLA